MALFFHSTASLVMPAPVLSLLLLLTYGLMSLTIILLFSERISMPYLAAVSSSLRVSCSMSYSLLPSRSMSSANRKLKSGRPPMGTDDNGVSVSSASSTASSVKQSFTD